MASTMTSREDSLVKNKINRQIKDLRNQLTILNPQNLFDKWQTHLQIFTLYEMYKNLFGEQVKDHDKYKLEYEQAQSNYSSELNRLNRLQTRPIPVAPTLAPSQPISPAGGTGEFQSKEDEDMCKYYVRTFIESDGCRDNWFDNITGLENVKQALVDNLVSARVLSSMFSRTPKGFLLYGPPGVGKTLLIKALVNELRDKTSSHIKLKGQIGALFYNVGAAELKDKYVGESEKKIQNLFKMASLAAETVQNAQRAKGGVNSNYKVFSIIFMDEVDDIAPDRSKNNTASSSVNSLLTAIDGMTSSSNVVVIAATNHPGGVDPAFRERLPKRIFLDYPTEQEIYTFLAQRMDIMINKNIEVSHLGVGANPSAIKTSDTKGCDIVSMYEESNCRKPGPRLYSMLQEDIGKFIPNLSKEDLLNLAIACSGKNVPFEDGSSFVKLAGREDRLSNRQLDSIITQASEKAANRASKIGVFAKSRIGDKDYLFSLDSFPVVEWMGKDPATFQFIKEEKPPEKPIITFQEETIIKTQGQEDQSSMRDMTCYHLKFLPFVDTTLLNPTDAYYGVSPFAESDHEFYSDLYLGYLAETALYCMGRFENQRVEAEEEISELDIQTLKGIIVNGFKGVDILEQVKILATGKVFKLGEKSRFRSSNTDYENSEQYLKQLFEHMIQGHWDFDYFREKLKEASLPSFSYSKIINALRWARLKSEVEQKTHVLFLKYRVAFYFNPISNDVGNYDTETPTRALQEGTDPSSTDYFVEDIYVQIREDVRKSEDDIKQLLDVKDVEPASIWDTTPVDTLQQYKWNEMEPEDKDKFIEDIKPEHHKLNYDNLVAERLDILENLASFKSIKGKNISFYIPEDYTPGTAQIEKLKEIWHVDHNVSEEEQRRKQMNYLKSLSSRKMYAGELDEKIDVGKKGKSFLETLISFWSKEQTTIQTKIADFAKHKVRALDMREVENLPTNMDKLLYKNVFKGSDLDGISFDNEPRLDLALNWNIDIRDLVEAASRERQSFTDENYKALRSF